MHVHMCVCVHTCVCVWKARDVLVYVLLCLSVCLSVCVSVCLYACLCVMSQTDCYIGVRDTQEGIAAVFMVSRYTKLKCLAVHLVCILLSGEESISS